MKQQKHNIRKKEKRIENEILRIRQDDKRAKEQAEIEERNRKTAMENMKKNKGTYLSPYLPTDGDVLVNQTESPQSSRNTAHTNLRKHYEQKCEMGFPPGFGGKRKTRKSKKSNKRRRKTRSKRQRGGMDFDIPKSKADVDDILPGKKDYILPNGESLRSILMRKKSPYVTQQPTENWTGKEKRANQRSKFMIDKLIWASANGDTEKLNEALNNGVDVNANSSEFPYGWTALHHATENGHSEIAKMLLDAGADVNATVEEREYTPHDDNSDGYQYDGMPVNRQAFFNNRIEILKMLLEKGVDVNTTIDNVNNTFLHFASLRGNIDMVKMLLDAGADVNAKNDDGETAIDLAKSEWQTPTMELLEKAISHQNLRDIREAVRSGETDMPASGQRIFSWAPGQGPNPGDFLGGKRKTRKSKKSKRKNPKNSFKKTEGWNVPEYITTNSVWCNV